MQYGIFAKTTLPRIGTFDLDQNICGFNKNNNENNRDYKASRAAIKFRSSRYRVRGRPFRQEQESTKRGWKAHGYRSPCQDGKYRRDTFPTLPGRDTKKGCATRTPNPNRELLGNSAKPSPENSAPVWLLVARPTLILVNSAAFCRHDCAVVVHQDAVAGAVEILVLPALQRPPEHGGDDEDEQQRNRNQEIQDIHLTLAAAARH